MVRKVFEEVNTYLSSRSSPYSLSLSWLDGSVTRCQPIAVTTQAFISSLLPRYFPRHSPSTSLLNSNHSQVFKTFDIQQDGKKPGKEQRLLLIPKQGDYKFKKGDVVNFVNEKGGVDWNEVYTIENLGRLVDDKLVPEADSTACQYLLRGKLDSRKELCVRYDQIMLASWHFHNIGQKVHIAKNKYVGGEIVKVRWSAEKGFEVDVRLNGNKIEEVDEVDPDRS